MAKEHWRQKQSLDKYFLESKAKGFRSRSAFKLVEIDQKIKLFSSNISILDLGSTPGGWSQYISKKNHKKLNIIATDINVMTKINGVSFFQGDFTEKSTQESLINMNNNNKFNIILSDISPNKSGNKVTDQYIFYDLVSNILEFSKIALINEGKIVIKVFHGLGFEDFTNDCRKIFETVKFFKPKACRTDSKETYMIAEKIRYNSKNE